MPSIADLKGSVTGFLHRFGEVMGGLVLGVLYFLVLGPISLAVRLLTDPLRRRRRSGTAFVDWERLNETLRAARRQG
jgi:hypothetical protein